MCESFLDSLFRCSTLFHVLIHYDPEDISKDSSSPRSVSKVFISADILSHFYRMFGIGVFVLGCLDLRRKFQEYPDYFTSSLVASTFASGIHMVVNWFSGITGVLSIFSAIVNIEASVEIVLNVLSLPGAILLLLGTYKGYKYDETDKIINGSGLYTPLNGEPNGSAKTDSVRNVTHYAKAGFFSRMSFWWFNPLMKRGTEKTLVSEDIPKLREQDRAEAVTCSSWRN